MKKFGLRWLPLGLLCVVAVGCGGSDSPTTPTPVTPNFAGTWAGSGRLVQCTGNQTACGSTNPNATSPTEFVLTQTGTSVSGTWNLNNAEPRIAVTGTVAADGALNLSGRPAGFPVALDNSRLTVTGTAMSTLVYTFTFPDPAQGSATLMLELVGVTRR
jgi:hypothetical protein